MNALKNRSSSWRKAVSNNEKLQLKEIRKQNNDLIRTLKNSRYGNLSSARKRLYIQLNADKAQNKLLYKRLKANPSNFRSAVRSRRKTQLRAVRRQDKAIM